MFSILGKRKVEDEKVNPLSKEESDYFQHPFKYSHENKNYDDFLDKWCTVPYKMDFYSALQKKNIKYIQTYNGIIRVVYVADKKALIEFQDNTQEIIPFSSIYPLQEETKWYKAFSYLGKEIKNPIEEERLAFKKLETESNSFLQKKKKTAKYSYVRREGDDSDGDMISEEDEDKSEKSDLGKKRNADEEEVIAILVKLHEKKLDGDGFLLPIENTSNEELFVSHDCECYV